MKNNNYPQSRIFQSQIIQPEFRKFQNVSKSTGICRDMLLKKNSEFSRILQSQPIQLGYGDPSIIDGATEDWRFWKGCHKRHIVALDVAFHPAL